MWHAIYGHEFHIRINDPAMGVENTFQRKKVLDTIFCWICRIHRKFPKSPSSLARWSQLKYLFILHWTCSVQTKFENRPRSTLREQRLFYNRSQISINIQSSFWLNKFSAEYNTQQQFSEDSAFYCWYMYVELNPRLCRWVSFEKNIY
jgi:hypothetical protein